MWQVLQKENRVVMGVGSAGFFLLFSWLLVVLPFGGSAQGIGRLPVPHIPTMNSTLSQVGTISVLRPETQVLLASIRRMGFEPSMKGDASRDFFATPGVFVTMQNDTFSVFEYPDSVSAEADVISFQKSARTPKRAWKQDVHLYAHGALIVFYLGESKAILSSLSGYFGKEITL